MKNYPSNKNNIFTETNNIFVDNLGIIILIALIVSCLFIFPTSAADEPSEGGGSAAPVDLTDTTWLISIGNWSVNAGYGQFNVDASVAWNTNTYDIFQIVLGYNTLSGNTPVTPTPDVVIYRFATGHLRLTPDEPTSDVVITFTGGTDATNPSLISWLMSNGTWTNAPEPEPTPTYTIPIGSYLINERIDTPPMLSPYIYTGRFSYDGKVYTNLVFQYTGIVLIDESGDITTIYLRSLIDNPWGDSDRNFTLLSEIVTDDEELYNYFINNTQPYEPDVFDVVVYFISGFFKALDNFLIFYNFSLLDFIFVMCGLLAAVWFLKLLAGG